MKNLFTTILNMSITASYVALAVIVIRIFLKKLPKIFSYILWLPVFIRLIFPFSFKSHFSFLRFFNTNVETTTETIKYIPHNIISTQNPNINMGIKKINNTIPSSLLPTTPKSSINSIQMIIKIASIIWIIGIVSLIIFSIISYLKVIRNVQTATLVKNNIFETDMIDTPFVCGFIKPKIYIPTIITEEEFPYILAHEQTHIKRLDYLIKPFAFLVLILHWFNPIIWLSFALMSKDMEMSCDENVLKKMGNHIKGSYSKSLLLLSTKKSPLIIDNHLAFGASNIKSRIKNILSYKKPALWVVTVLIIITTILIVVFTTNPKTKHVSEPITYSLYNTQVLINNKTPYVGDNSKVIALVDAMPLPEHIERDTIELQTTTHPYGITINLKINNSFDSYMLENISMNNFYRNSILLFSLIDNVDIINFKISNNTGMYNNNKPYIFTYTRKMVEKLIGTDIHSYSANTTTLKTLINQLNSISFNIEKYLQIIMSSPNTSSNPMDYIKAHQNEYDNILKLGDKALNYLLTQFKKNSNNNNLRGYIMMNLCKDILGDRNNVTDESLSPNDWFSQLSPYEETKLPDFKAKVSDPIEQLVYDTVIKQYSDPNYGFTVVAPTILGSYEEKNKLKVFVTFQSSHYRLYDKTLCEGGGSIIPAAITYTKNSDGSYTLDEYLEPMDGAYFSKSIKKYCTMPVSNKKIPDLYDKIFKNLKNNNTRSELLMKNLIEHLKSNNQKNIILKQLPGELIPLT